MSLEDFFESNYQTACEMQRSIIKDSKMKAIAAKSIRDEELVLSWMRDYGLFQGIKTEDRKSIVKKYFFLLPEISKMEKGEERENVEKLFRLILSEFYSTVGRKWLSATSKLLWCSYPDHVVIYDAFVERSLVILQGIVPYLASMPRIKSSPNIKSWSDIDAAIDFYMNYQDMVLAIANEHEGQLSRLRKQYNETYAHDIRIIDKLLWMLGNPNQEFTLNEVQCNTSQIVALK
ncbi:hypothetical protein [Sulfurovum sp.]|uniref:hypothetical protein n=1 Tax=Sulfurovum sp. TaxID=1969726 RepID=UPI0035679F4C